ncbi:Lipase 2 [Polystyrenella longa]|uniref:Lipase 2 n=1 Tax=Polystyrenella longa TaxID=2528007 RepID=A0A518CH42_9PLAN|nr:alpha/beta hydrolase [Polystyrenella longa]QDU78547.1 Lipase 2 [Polystyrenella longa]
MNIRRSLFTVVVGLSAGLWVGIEQVQAEVKTIADIEYANIEGTSLQLDLYLPEEEKQPRLVVWVHGGGWVQGSRKKPAFAWMAEEGYAVASISYRFSDKAAFPAQIYDCKGAIRWLRAHAEEYGYNADKIVAGGASAGGHLVALLGTSGDVQELEGSVGGNLDQSSRIQGVIDLYGATDFILRSQTQTEKLNSPDSYVYQLFGGPPKEKMELLRSASAVTFISADDPPMLVLHGVEDKVVLPGQSERINEAYLEAGLPVELIMIDGAGHGGSPFSTPEIKQKMREFVMSCFAE